MKNFPLVMIEWHDHETYDPWATLEEIKDAKKELWSGRCNTIGWIIDEEPDAYKVASTINESGTVCQVFRILKGAVIQVRKIRAPAKRKNVPLCQAASPE